MQKDFQLSFNPDYCMCLTWPKAPLKWIFSPIQQTLGLVLSITNTLLPVNIQWPCQSHLRSVFHPRLWVKEN